MTTFIIGGTLVGILFAGIATWAALLRLGLHWAKAPTVTGRRLVLAVTIVVLYRLAYILIMLGAFGTTMPDNSMLFWGIEIAVSVVLPCLVIGRVFGTKGFRTIQAWLPTLLSPVVGALLILVVVQPYILEGFRMPTNSMAPTLLGEHAIGTCPVCGGQAYSSPRKPNEFVKPMMICKEFHLSEITPDSDDVSTADRFIVGKFNAPERWDILVFRLPSEPEILYAKRLVGMPGETITIEDGSVVVDGTPLDPPASLRRLRYVIDQWGGLQIWGSADNPAQLGPDEYFVLGDFTRRSRDSRYWQEGAEGRAPYAVPASHIVGVVTHIYWPLKRWRILK